ncbi:MAG TPA: polysaccharide biosynthesis/export family protein [Noviherbaspirillum sp.]|nr:polysaccharide biosynthesis/export family protein [Noviherbaspirillum sp.]
MKSISIHIKRRSLAALFGLVAAGALTGCASNPTWLPSAGPNRDQVQQAADAQSEPKISIVDVNDAVARKLLSHQKQSLFSETFSAPAKPGYMIGAGDIIEVSVWEAPPASLFGGVVLDPRSGPATTRVTTFPEQMVNSDGAINVPFAGQVNVAGQSPNQIEAEIVRRLKGKANQPQVLVRVIRNNTANVTVVGEVVTSTRMPLTGRGERLLDALAAAGGVRQPVSKMTLQITRGNHVQALPLETIIRDPKQNVMLQPGDVITSLFQPLSFTVLGATGKNEEVNFEAQGISLAQALARAGGLQDARADAQGVFIFRFESAAALDLQGQSAATTPEGKVPVIYRVDLKDPATFFVAQSFPIQNKDVLYVSNAPAAELQKFLNIVGSVVYPIISIQNSVR